MVSVDHTKSDHNASEDEDITIVATQEGNVVQCSTQVHDYHFHSPALSHLLVWDFVSQVDKVKKPDGSCCVNSDVDENDYPESSDEDDNEPMHEVEDSPQDQQMPQNTQRGRISWTFPLHPQHTQSGRKAQRLWSDLSSYFIPVLIGPSLPHCNRAELLPKYCYLMLILFKLWRGVGDL